jgi:hypothetical protein
MDTAGVIHIRHSALRVSLQILKMGLPPYALVQSSITTYEVSCLGMSTRLRESFDLPLLDTPYGGPSPLCSNLPLYSTVHISMMSYIASCIIDSVVELWVSF